MLTLVSTRGFEVASARHLSGVRTGGEALLRREVGEIARDLALATPPGGPGASGSASRKRGENSVLANTLRVVTPVSGVVVGGASTAQVVKANWRNGRTMRRSRKVIVSRGDFERYIQQTLPKVGYTAGGFAIVARQLGASLPTWITDRPGPGSVALNFTGDLLSIRFANSVPWIGQLGVGARFREIERKGDARITEGLAELTSGLKFFS